MIEPVEEQEKKELWDLYTKVDTNGKKIMLYATKSVLNIQLLSEGKKSLGKQEGKNKKT
jgi:hypothetical protein